MKASVPLLLGSAGFQPAAVGIWPTGRSFACLTNSIRRQDVGGDGLEARTPQFKRNAS